MGHRHEPLHPISHPTPPHHPQPHRSLGSLYSLYAALPIYAFTHTRTRVYTLCTVFPSSASLAFTFARFTPSVSITTICSFCWYNIIIIPVIYISCVCDVRERVILYTYIPTVVLKNIMYSVL